MNSKNLKVGKLKLLRAYAIKKSVKFYFLIVALHCISNSQAQVVQSIAFFNTDEVWQKLKPVKADDFFKNKKHVILLASNRQHTDTGLRFMEMHRNTNGAISYFMIAEDGDSWWYKEFPNMKEALAHYPIEASWVIYNEGMGKIFTTNISRAMLLQKQYNVAVFMLDYPSITNTTRPIKSYRFAVKNARNMYLDFATVLDSFRWYHVQSKSTRPVNLLMHSMGNYMIRNMVKHNYYPEVYKNRWLDNIIFNAACVPSHGHKKWLSKVSAAKNIWVHYNSEDKTLKFASFAMFQRQLGGKVNKRISSNTHYINFNPTVGEAHNYYLQFWKNDTVSSPVKKHYAQLFHGEIPDLKDSVEYEVSPFKEIGWAIKPAEK